MIDNFLWVKKFYDFENNKKKIFQGMLSIPYNPCPSLLLGRADVAVLLRVAAPQHRLRPRPDRRGRLGPARPWDRLQPSNRYLD